MNQFQLPTHLKIGNFDSDSIAKLIHCIIPSDSRVLVAADDFVFNKYGKDIAAALEKKKHTVIPFFVSSGSVVESIDLAKRAIEFGFTSIIGIGGGRVLDVSKFAGNMAKVAVINIPTVAANDGIASPIAVLKGEDGRTKSLGAKVPTSIIISTSIIRDAPIKFIKAGIGDILSNMTALYDWKVANQNTNEPINDFAALISRFSYESIVNSANRNLENESFIVQILESLVLSGIAMEIAGSSRPCSGSEHLFSHALDFYFPDSRLHGLQVALGAIISAKLQGQDYNQLIQLLKSLAIDVSPKALSIPLDQFCYAWLNCQNMRPNRYTILNTMNLTDADLIDIYNEINRKFAS